jgi:putative hydrolase of the HAD superfamily
MPKEDQGFWQRLYMEEEISPESALLIDDSLPVLRSAHHAGVGHILFVTQPDSQKPERQCDEFPGVRCFRDLIQGMDI